VAKRWCVGKLPKNGTLVAVSLIDPGWMLFDTSNMPGPWKTLKLVAMAPNYGGANFCFGWNGRRLSYASDNQRLHAISPELLEWVVDAAKSMKS
jgi:hypothetical protein